MKHADEEQLRFISPSARLESEQLDALISVWGGSNTKEMTGVDPKRLAIPRVAQRPLFEKLLARIGNGSLRWCGTQFPTASAAQDAEMATAEYEDFVYGAGLLEKKDPIGEWKKVSTRQGQMTRVLNRKKTLRIVGPDTDLSFKIGGRKWINCDGHENFPDGEVFTGPIENSAEGRIRYSFPAVYGGKEVENVRLVFKRGRVVESKADKGETYLNSVLDSDPGARYVGELAMGTNFGIKCFTRNTLFDEKIGGTMHIALGNGSFSSIPRLSRRKASRPARRGASASRASASR